MMNFNSAKYLSNGVNNTHVQLNLGNNKFKHVVIDPDSKDYQAILEWVAEGNTIQDAD